MNKETHAWIFVKSDSIDFPERNRLLLNGKPLIAYTIEAALKSRHIKKVFISTDSPDIAAVSEQYGAIVPFLRPQELSTGKVPIQQAWKHAVEWNRNQTEFPQMDIMVALPMTVPLRSAEDIEKCDMLVFNDLHMFEPCDAKSVNLAIYDSTSRSVLLSCLNSVYSEIGGPLQSAFASYHSYLV